MGKVFFDVGVSLDGAIAGPNRGPDNPLGDGGVALHGWMFATSTFRRRLGMEGGETSRDDAIVKEVFERAGAYVLGRRMFEEGEVSWPEEAPFGAPVFVLTHRAREPWPRKGGTTFYFVTDGIESALAQARAAAGGKDVRISGGAQTIRQYLEAGLIDDFALHIAPKLLPDGLRLFEGIRLQEIHAVPAEAISTPLVTHLRYRIARG